MKTKSIFIEEFSANNAIDVLTALEQHGGVLYPLPIGAVEAYKNPEITHRCFWFNLTTYEGEDYIMLYEVLEP